MAWALPIALAPWMECCCLMNTMRLLVAESHIGCVAMGQYWACYPTVELRAHEMELVRPVVYL